MKTLAGWHQSKLDLALYLEVGDLCDRHIVEHMRDSVPPVRDSSALMQAGEAVSHVDGRATYTTFRKSASQWVYAGCCYAGESRQPPVWRRALAWTHIAWPGYVLRLEPSETLSKLELEQLANEVAGRGYDLIVDQAQRCVRVEKAVAL